MSRNYKNYIKKIYKLILKISNFLKISTLPLQNIYFKVKNYFFWNFKDYLKMVRFYSQFFKKGDLCFDIGAHIGVKTRNYLQAGGKVLCVEPQKHCLIKLYKLFGNNKNVIIVGKALGDKEGFGEIYICESQNRLSTLSKKFRNKSYYSKKFKWNITQKIEITTLDKLIQTYGFPQFCKIDVENYEVEVIKGLTKKIPYLCFEFQREFFDDAKECINHLLSIGPAKFNFVIGKELTKLYLPKWVSPSLLYESIKIVKKNLRWGDIYVKFL